jgi:hypothetical protein
MALWGNRDTFAITGTVDVENGSATVAGTSTVFTTELQIGDAVVIAGVKYKVANIASNTSLTLGSAYAGSTDTGLTITGQDVPKFLSQAEMRDTYGVDVTETSAGGDNVTEVAVVNGGRGYSVAPAVTFSGGGGSGAAATAVISGGAVTSITVTDVGSSYETVPTVAIAAPVLTFNGATAVDPSTDKITATAHTFETGDAVVYTDGGGTAIVADVGTFDSVSDIDATEDTITITGHAFLTGDPVVYADGAGSDDIGLVDATTYYVVVVDEDTIKLSDTAAHAIAGTDILDLNEGSAAENQTLTYSLVDSETYYVIDSGTNDIQLARTAALATAGTQVDITADGVGASHTLTFAAGTATATASKGSGATGTQVTNPGWVKRTVGTGGRAGRVQYETLVAGRTISGDASDDIQFPDS